MSKFADNLEDLAEKTAEYIRYLEQEVSTLKEEKNYLLRKAGENVAEIAKLQDQVKNSLVFAELAIDRAQNFCDEYLENEAREFVKVIKRS